MTPAWWKIALGAALVLSALWWSGRLAAETAVRRFFRPPRRPPRPLPAILQDRAEDVTIPGAPRTSKAWLLRPAVRPAGVVVFAHGWSSDGGRLAPLSLPLLEDGFACLLWDMPGHGRSPEVETYNVVLLLKDLAALRDWIATRDDLKDLPAALVGYSFGGLGTLLSGETGRGWSALASLAAPVGPMEAIEAYFRQRGLPGGLLRRLLHGAIHRVAGVDPETLDIPSHLAALDVPLLVIHGEKDEVIPVSHAEAIVAAAPPGRATLAVVDGARHDGLMNHPEARERLRRFLEEAFRSKGVQPV